MAPKSMHLKVTLPPIKTFGGSKPAIFLIKGPPNVRFHVNGWEGGGLILPLILRPFEYQGLILTHVRLVGNPLPWGFQVRGSGHGVLTELFTNTCCGNLRRVTHPDHSEHTSTAGMSRVSRMARAHTDTQTHQHTQIHRPTHMHTHTTHTHT